MPKMHTVTHRFVDAIPSTLQDGVVYVSIEYGTVVHACCCGCREEVVTPLSPTDWKLIFDGETVSLFPSIGNWSLECRSHYWIREDRVYWARSWTEVEIAEGRAADLQQKNEYFGARFRGEPYTSQGWRPLFNSLTPERTTDAGEDEDQ